MVSLGFVLHFYNDAVLKGFLRECRLLGFFFEKEDCYFIERSTGIRKNYIIEVWWHVLHPHRQTSNMSSMFS